MKKYLSLLLILMCVLFIPSVYAVEVDDTYNYCERNMDNNYGVNKKWRMTTQRKFKAQAMPCVDTTQKIYDYANILTDDEEAALKEQIYEYISETKSDLIIVTVDSYYYQDSENEDFAADFYDYNDFGIDFDHYSGTVLLRNVNISDPYYNIYTFGDAQLYFYGYRTENTLDVIYDDLHSGYYYNGFSRFISKFKTYHKNGIPYSNKNDYLDDDGFYHKGFRPPFIICTVASFIVSLITVLVLKGKHKTVKKETKADDYLDFDSVKYTKRENNFLNTITTSVVMSSSSGGSGGGGGHSHGSSGGGHSSGGGRHG